MEIIDNRKENDDFISNNTDINSSRRKI